MKRNDLKIEVTGHHGAVWNPRLSDVPIAAIKWRLPPSLTHPHRELRRADVRLRHARVSRLLNEAFCCWCADRGQKLVDDARDARQEWRATEEYRQLKATMFHRHVDVRSADLSDPV